MSSIFHDGVLVDINVSFWSGAKALKPEDLGLDPKTVPEAYRLGKKFLIPADVIRRFRSVEGKARRVVESNSFKFPIGNARFVPRNKFPKVLKELEGHRADYAKYVDDLIANYDKHRADMLPVYRQAAETAFLAQDATGVQEFSMEQREAEKDAFVGKFLKRIETFYPAASSLRSKFSLDWDVYEIAVPKLQRAVAARVAGEQEAAEDYREQARRKIEAFVDDVVRSLRAETIELCARITSNIKEGKVVRARTLKTLKEFIERFSDLNFVGDKTIEDHLACLRHEFLDVHSSDEISEQTDLQAELGRRLGVVQEAATNINDVNTITGEYRRKVQWQDGEEEGAI